MKIVKNVPVTCEAFQWDGSLEALIYAREKISKECYFEDGELHMPIRFDGSALIAERGEWIVRQSTNHISVLSDESFKNISEVETNLKMERI